MLAMDSGLNHTCPNDMVSVIFVDFCVPSLVMVVKIFLLSLMLVTYFSDLKTGTVRQISSRTHVEGMCLCLRSFCRIESGLRVLPWRCGRCASVASARRFLFSVYHTYLRSDSFCCMQTPWCFHIPHFQFLVWAYLPVEMMFLVYCLLFTVIYGVTSPLPFVVVHLILMYVVK